MQTRSRLCCLLLMLPIGVTSCASDLEQGDCPGEDCCAAKCDGISAHDTPLGVWHAQRSRSGTNVSNPDMDVDELGLPGASTSITIAITRSTPSSGLSGTLTDEDGTRPLSSIRWERSRSRLRFVDAKQGVFEWYEVNVAEGVLVGRSAPGLSSANRPTDYHRFDHHITGWNETQLNQDLVPRTFDILVNDVKRAVLRIDRAPAGSPRPFVGRIDVSSSTLLPRAGGVELEEDLEVHGWDGRTLSFTQPSSAGPRRFTGEVIGDRIAGTLTKASEPGRTFRWAGRQTQVLGFGLTARTPAEREAWQTRTRRQLQLLMQGGAPTPISHTFKVLREVPSPFPHLTDWGNGENWSPDRDDDPDNQTLDYRLTEFETIDMVPNPYDPAHPIPRRNHGWITTPTLPPPPGGYRGALILNGHSSSARAAVQADSNGDGYGDWFSRRGYVIVALDLGHRPHDERNQLYNWFDEGDDPSNWAGNRVHPSVRADGMDSDWVEDGERSYDASRGIDLLLAQPNIDPDHIVVAGLSMGGSQTLITSALDTRVAMGVAKGVGLDVALEYFNQIPDDPHYCVAWAHANVREYIDRPDFIALIAPRPFLLSWGQHELPLTPSIPGWVDQKQGVRRGRAAYGAEADRFIFDLHHMGHYFHAGNFNPHDPDAPRGVRVPDKLEPDASGSNQWQLDVETHAGDEDTFAAIDRMLGGPPL